MLPEGVLNIAIRADFWQPQKNERKAELISVQNDRTNILGQKSAAKDSWPYFCQILTDIKKFTERFLGKFAVKWILKIQPHLACVATLPCEILTLAKQAINDKLQGSYIFKVWWGFLEVFNNQINKGLLLSLWVKFSWNRWLFAKVTSKNVIDSCTLRAWPTHR